MPSIKIIFVDSVHESLPARLVGLGCDCDLRYDISREEAEAVIPGYQGIVIRSKFRIDNDFLDKATNLQFIARYGAGMENVDVAYAESKEITCLAAPEGNRDAVGNHALAMLLSLLNNICKANNEVRKGVWEREGNRGTELDGKTVGIIGYGNTGSAFARRLQGFNVQVLAYDKYKSGFDTDHVKEAAMEEVFNETDILSLHVPISDETDYLFDSSYLSRFKKDIVLINTSRGKVVKTDDLVTGMRSGKVKGACLDVLEYEHLSFENLENENLPEAYQYLLGNPNVILTPHIAGWSFESYGKLADVLLVKIKDVLK